MAQTKWILDSTHSELGFKIKHLMITNVSGSFKNFNAEVISEETDFGTAQINLSADMASISTNNDQRDAHLRNSDFFEVEQYPELNFRSTTIEKKDSDTYTLFGELTMKGITKPVKLNVECLSADWLIFPFLRTGMAPRNLPLCATVAWKANDDGVEI